MPIVPLWKLIFTFIFDEKSTAHCTQKVIEEQILKWNGFIQINKKRELEKFGLDPEARAIPVGKKGSVLDEMEYQIQLMCSWLVKNEEGQLDAKKELYKKHKIDFRLVEPMCKVFPEYANRRNMKKGAAALKRAMEENPSDYGINKKARWRFTAN